MVGVGEAGYGPAAQALIAEFYRGRQRAFAIGIYSVGMAFGGVLGIWLGGVLAEHYGWRAAFVVLGVPGFLLAILASDRKSTRLNSSHSQISYAVFCLKKKTSPSGGGCHNGTTFSSSLASPVFIAGSICN